MKAIVMETRGDRAVILLKDGTFRTVKGSYAVGDTIDYRETARPLFRKWLVAAATAVIMIGAGGGFWYDANYVAYAEISLDVNPSIAYTVNKRGRVLEVRAVTNNAAEVVSTLEEEGIRFTPVAQAIARTMALFEDDGYLDPGNEDYILMNVSADNADLQEKLTDEIETGMESAMEHNLSMTYRVDHSDLATAERASENHMSTGRYAVWENEGEGRELEEYAEMPVSEILGQPEKTDPAEGEGDGAPQTGADAPVNPAEGTMGQGAPDAPEQQMLAEQGAQGGPDKPEEPEALSGEPEQNAPSAQPEPDEEQGREPAAPAEKTEPAAPNGGTEPAAPAEKTEPAAPNGETEPAAPAEKTEPAASDGETGPAAKTEPAAAAPAGKMTPAAGTDQDPQQNEGKKEPGSSSDREQQRNGMKQGAPGNAPGQPGNQPPR